MDLAVITTAIGAVTSAVSLFDKIADQVEHFLTKKTDLKVQKQHRLKYEKSGDAIVAKWKGKISQKVTADELEKRLSENQLRHIKVLEQSMENHYSIWAKVYPKLALELDDIKKAKLEQQIKGIIADMKGDLNGIFKFIEDCGIQLDDHYRHIVELISRE